MNSQRRGEIHYEGSLAWANDKEETDCPYDEGSEEAEVWLLGYRAASFWFPDEV